MSGTVSPEDTQAIDTLELASEEEVRLPVPDVLSLLLPTLRALEDGAETSSIEIRRRVAAAEGLTPQELREMPPESPVPSFTNHVAWALVGLQKSGWAVKVRKSVYRLTPEGARRLGTSRR